MTPTDPNERARELLKTIDRIEGDAQFYEWSPGRILVEVRQAIRGALSHAAAVEDDSDDSWCQCETCRRRKDPQPAPAAVAVAGGEGEALARRFHETYERLAPSFGYETRKETREFDPTTPNGRLMIAVCTALAAQPAAGDGPIDAIDNADYIVHCAGVLEALGYRVTAGALRVIADEYRTLATPAAQRPGAGDVRLDQAARIIEGLTAMLFHAAVMGTDCTVHGRRMADIIGDLRAAESADEIEALISQPSGGEPQP